MKRSMVFLGAVLMVLVTGARSAPAQTLAPPPLMTLPTLVPEYDAIADRMVRPKPPLPPLGPAGSTVTDPAFYSTIIRVTDASTRPGLLKRSYRSPSNSHQSAWSARGSYFYVVSTDRAIIPFAFDAATGVARRIQPSTTGDGGLVIRTAVEPQFSYVDDNIIYGSLNTPGSTLRTIDRYDFSTGVYSRVIDLDTVVPGLAGTVIGGISSTSGPVERILTFFGGAAQDRHRYVLVFDRGNPQNRWILDSTASTINGSPTAVPLQFRLHDAGIDRSGRYVMLYPTAADRAAPRNAAPVYVWDLVTSAITELPAVSGHSNGPDAYGFGTLVNQDCCTTTTWDAAQWQLRSLATPLVTRDLLTSVLTPKEVYLADDSSWNNAQPDRLAAYISALYRYGTNDTAWRAWDDEIVAVQTDALDADATVWRFAHHRSNVASDTDPARIAFWYTPRPNVSPDGKWVLFTSNWEKTLGKDPGGEPGGAYRQDAFLLELKPTDWSTPTPSPEWDGQGLGLRCARCAGLER